jgi:cytochrome c-type biogenesis protein CcmH
MPTRQRCKCEQTFFREHELSVRVTKLVFGLGLSLPAMSKTWSAALVVAVLFAAGAGWLWWRSIATPVAQRMPFPRAPQAAQLAGDKRVAAWAQQLQMHVDQQPSDVKSWRLLAQTHMSRNDWVQAATAWQRSLALDPRHADSHAGLAQSLAAQQQGRLAGAPEAAITAGLTLAPHHPGLLAMAGELALEQGHKAQAVARFEALLAAERAQPNAVERIKAIEQRLAAVKAMP